MRVWSKQEACGLLKPISAAFLIFVTACSCFASAQGAQPAIRSAAEPVMVEPDRPFERAGRWQISTARWGVGCVAELEYEQHHFVFIGGAHSDALTVNVTVNGNRFEQDLSSDEGVGLVELVLGNDRFGEADDLKPDGYRGRAGVLIHVDRRIRDALLALSSIKITERGALRLRIPVEGMKAVFATLNKCFVKTR